MCVFVSKHMFYVWIVSQKKLYSCIKPTANSEQEHAVGADYWILSLYRCEESVSDDPGRLLRTAELPLDYPWHQFHLLL